MAEFPKPGALEKDGAGDYRYPDQFEACWAVYPERDGSNSKKAAYRKWRSTVRNGADPDQLMIATLDYRDHCERRGKIGTPYVKRAATFFGPDEHWRQEWANQPESVRDADHRAMKTYRETLEAIRQANQ